jgi:hypothetical protein
MNEVIGQFFIGAIGVYVLIFLYGIVKDVKFKDFKEFVINLGCLIGSLFVVWLFGFLLVNIWKVL